MEDIRFLGLEGNDLLLETESGEQFRLVVDDAMRRLLRKESITPPTSEEISPRDIQIQIRSGVTVAELAANTGASVEYIEKFAATVIDELQHVIASALAVRIQVPGDRFNEPIQSEFGEVISERLARLKASGITWTSKRDEAGTWLVECNFKTSNGQQSATWSFDLRKLVLTPENDAAYQLQTQAPLTAKPAPVSTAKPGLSDDPLAPTGTIVAPVIAAPKAQPAPVKPVAKKPEPEAPVAPTEPAKVVEFPNVETSTIDVQNLATTVDLTEVLRKRAAEAKISDESEAHDVAPVDSETQPEPKVEPKAKSKPERPVVEDLEATAPIETKPKTGRVPVQSWEEILLSTRSEDDQAN